MSRIIPAFAGGTMDRADQLRVNPDALQKAMMRPNARLLQMNGLDPIYDDQGHLAWGPVFESDPDNALLLLGLIDDVPHFAEITGVAAASAFNPRLWQGLAMLPPDQAAIYAAARSLIDWHARHQFCANCGLGTQVRKGGWARHCEKDTGGCGAEHFPRVDPVSIMTAECDGKVLLGRQPQFPPKSYSALAGFIEPGEGIEGGVARELWEEAGIKVHDVEYVASQPWPFPSSLMIACTSKTDNPDLTIDTEELDDARWFTLDEVKAALAGSPDAVFNAPPPFAIARNLLEHWVKQQ